MDIGANQAFEDHLGRVIVLAVAYGWVMFSRGEAFKPDFLTTAEFRNRFVQSCPDQVTRHG